jgi:hypothetical protein
VTPRPPPGGSERGAALLMTLMVVALVAGLGGALLLVASMETAVQTHHLQAHAVRQAAESGLACAVSELQRTPEWASLLGGAAPPVTVCLGAATLPPPWALGAFPAASERTAALQADTDARYGVMPDTPVWTLRAAGAGPSATAAPPIVFVWIADDVEDEDGDPAADANGRLWVRAEAWGPAGARAAVEAIVRRDPDGDSQARVGAWRSVR